MDPETKKFVTSKDVVFDEISSHYSAKMFSAQEAILDVQKVHSLFLKDYEVQLNHCTVASCFFVGGLDEEPANYEEAKEDPKWQAAMEEEIEALNKNQTWNLVPKQENCNPITCKWAYKSKKNSDGVVEKFKAQLVARGFS